MAKLTLKEWLARLENNRRFKENVKAWKRIPEFSGQFDSFPSWLDGRIAALLRERGIEHLYSHQAEAVRMIREGQDTVLITPTASGKTLCYNIPVLQER